jgi:septal ring factor EnvC (AmiA/AmiB activator)
LEILQDRIATKTGHIYDEYLRLDETRRKAADAERVLKEEQAELKRQESRLATDLSTVRHDRDLLQERRLEIQEALRQIEKMVAMARDTAASKEPIIGQPLSVLKGALPWPVRGEILVPFGQQKSRRFETVTDNPGIDLSVSANEEVHCVADGRVAACTWLRGFGNLIIVEHPGEFFTVYAHLQELGVQRGSEVHTGQSLGTAGLDGISGQYRIHFELWEGKRKQNPLDWLTRR